MLAETPLGKGSGFGTPPLTGTVNIRGLSVFESMELLNSTDLPSGVHPRTRSASGCAVRRLGTPPAACTTKTSVLPSYCPLKATIDPSGEKHGLDSTPAALVRRCA